ncbi:restriction endonuclease subunit S [Ruminococcus callidus]
MREMKDSGVAWIGEIPKEWKILPNKYLMKKAKSICESYNGEDILSLSMKGVVVRDLNSGGKMPLSFDGYQYLKPGNLLMCLFDIDVTPRCIGLIRNNGLSSPAYSQFSLSNFAFNEYYYYYYLMLDNSKTLYHLAKNLRHSLTEEQLGMISTAVPPLSIQHQIATYLDQKCTQIDALITNQQKQIEKLKAYKQSLITETVTKGLNPDVPMKDSGVEWIGEIPKDSKVTRAGHIYSIVLGKMLSPSPKQNSDTLEYYLCAANVHFTGISYEPLKQMWFSEIEKQLYAVQCGDLLVVEGGAGAGGAAIVEESLNNYYIQNSIMIARPKGDVSNKWLYYSLYSLVKHNYIDFVCNKATIPHFTKDKLSKVPIIIVKKEKETEIINYLDQKCTQIDNLIAIKQQKIEKLQQYKKSLIYEYVTGKKEI